MSQPIALHLLEMAHIIGERVGEQWANVIRIFRPWGVVNWSPEPGEFAWAALRGKNFRHIVKLRYVEILDP